MIVILNPYISSTVYLVYRLLSSQNERERKKEEKKKIKHERKEKKKAK